MKKLLLMVGLFGILAVVPPVANNLGESQFASVKHPASETVKTTAVQSQLRKGEKIIWSSNIDLKRAAERAVPAGYVGIAVIFFSLICILSAPKHPIGIIWILFCLPISLVGIYMITGSYWTWRNNGNSVCLLTDKRACEFINGTETVSEPYSVRMIEPKIVKYRDERADVIFYERIDPDAEGIVREQKGFEGIENGEQCVQILKEKMAECKK